MTRRIRHYGIYILMLFLIFSFCMSGCGEKPQPYEGEEEQQKTSQEAVLPAIAGTEGQAELRGSYRVEEFNFPDPDLCLLELQGEGLKLQAEEFRLTTAGTVYREFVVYDVETLIGQSYIQKLEPPYDSWTISAVPDEYSDGEKEYYAGHCYDWCGRLAFRRLTDREENIHYWAGCDETGNITEVLGRLPEKLQQDVYDYKFVVSRAGKIYAYKESAAKELFCLNQSMETEKVVKSSRYSIDGVLSDASGEKVYWYGKSNDDFGIFDLSGEAVVQELEGFPFYGNQADMSGDGEIYIASSEKLWQLCGKEPKLLCNFTLRDYPWEELYDIKAQEDASVMLLGKLDGSYCLARAVEEKEVKQQEKQEMVIAFQNNHKAMLKSISRFNRQSDTYHITAILKEEDENWLDYNRRIQMEISAGRGPDIISDDLVVDISGYLENGYFASLEGVLDDESAYLQAAFEGGRGADGVLYGIPYDFEMEFVTYSKDFSENRTSWTLPELMKAVEKSDAEILQYDYDGVDIVMWYGLYDNDNKAYIDWEKGESHLTEEPFLELLDFAEKYRDKDKGKAQRETEGEMLLSKRAVATRETLHEFKELYGLDACFEGKWASLGFPRTEGNGIYARSRYLYINSFSACKEGAVAFIKFLLSEEEQSKYMIYELDRDSGLGYRPYFPVNLNAFQKLVDYSTSINPKVRYECDKRGMAYEIESLTEEQKEQVNFMLERIRPDNWYARNIQNIVSEELEPYFAGEKTAEQAAEILDRRVQLYLDERK